MGSDLPRYIRDIPEQTGDANYERQLADYRRNTTQIMGRMLRMFPLIIRGIGPAPSVYVRYQTTGFRVSCGPSRHVGGDGLLLLLGGPQAAISEGQLRTNSA